MTNDDPTTKHDKIKQQFIDHLKTCKTAKERAEAGFQVMDAYAEYVRLHASAAAPGEHDSVSYATNAAFDNTVRADNEERGITPTMDPAHTEVKARQAKHPTR